MYVTTRVGFHSHVSRVFAAACAAVLSMHGLRDSAVAGGGACAWNMYTAVLLVAALMYIWFPSRAAPSPHQCTRPMDSTHWPALSLVSWFWFPSSRVFCVWPCVVAGCSFRLHRCVWPCSFPRGTRPKTKRRSPKWLAKALKSAVPRKVMFGVCSTCPADSNLATHATPARSAWSAHALLAMRCRGLLSERLTASCF